MSQRFLQMDLASRRLQTVPGSDLAARSPEFSVSCQIKLG